LSKHFKMGNLVILFTIIGNFGNLSSGKQPDSDTLFQPALPQNATPGHYSNTNFHFQTTTIIQGDPSFRAKYSGPNSLNSKGEIQETITADLYAGRKLWRGAAVYADLLMWQGFGLTQTFGIEANPNGDAYKAGTSKPNYSFAHLFIRQTISLGAEQETVPDDQLSLAGKQSISRLTVTLGRFSPLDLCDQNSYAKDQHTQFLNWAMMGNISWDYGQNTIGYTTGVAVELTQPKWALRYGFFQMPKEKNGFTGDDQILTWPQRGAYGPFLKSWAMMLEFEKRYSIHLHPGVVRLLSWMDEANFASYRVATDLLKLNPPDPNTGQGSGITIPEAARAFRLKYGFGLNWEQEMTNNTGAFARLGWTDGHNETWTFTDVDWTISAGLNIKGNLWHRNGDRIGIAGIISGASYDNQQFLKAGGTDMLSGDGNLNYSPEKVMEAFYDFKICRNLFTTLDYQWVINPAFNKDRGPVSIFGARIHWEF